MVIRIKIEQLITIIKKETPEEDINHVVTEKTIEATEVTVEIVEEDIKVTVTSTTKTKIIKMKISITNNSILILRNSNKKIKETSKSSKEIVAVVTAEAIRNMIIIVVETEEEMTNNSNIILDQGEAMAKINIKTTTQIIKTLMEVTHSTEILRRHLTMNSKVILKKTRTSLPITVITIRIIRNKFEYERKFKSNSKNKKIKK